ncbi:hypothetical protein F0A16_01060 [Salinicola corii]|uniref:PepSY domain-containing protein n=1 Tax=Salinicola corii TaxID=2606937 RepID=A0A640WIR1_9GAMM|nr:hypothetical protein [Salinicola corii]KAA0020422.1 hypothetical protein F0A16_01060 [Salinicola corii]
MKNRLWVLPAVALGGGFGANALAGDTTLSYGQLEKLLNSAEDYGFNRYEKLDADHDDNRFEIEGWRADGWELDVAMTLNEGTLMRESQRKSIAPDWGLTKEELNAALSKARAEGMQHFAELEVDSDGHVEIEGYNAQQGQFELDLHREELNSEHRDTGSANG